MGLPAVHNTLADISGLDGAVWVFYSISTGNASVPTSGISWTSR
jgi:hypothetical protein